MELEKYLGVKNENFIYTIAALLMFGCSPIQPKLTSTTDPYTKKQSFTYDPIQVLDCEKMNKFSPILQVGFLGGENFNSFEAPLERLEKLLRLR